MKYHILFFRKFGKMMQNLLSIAVVIGALRVKESLRTLIRSRMILIYVVNYFTFCIEIVWIYSIQLELYMELATIV